MERLRQERPSPAWLAGEAVEARRARANWQAWLRTMATESIRLSTVVEDSRDIRPSMIMERPAMVVGKSHMGHLG